MRIVFGGESDTGNTRPENQDSLLITTRTLKDHQLVLGVICDGVGALEYGELASVAVTLLLREWFGALSVNATFEETADGLVEELHSLNTRISEFSRRQRMQTGTTASALLFFDERFAIAHIGDSRIYQVGHTVCQLTVDHAVFRVLPNSAHKQQKRYLTQCVGLRGALDPFFGIGVLTPGETYLLCSDGFYEQMEESYLRKRLRKAACKQELDGLATDLIRQIRKRPKNDNISLGIVKILPEP